MYSIHHHRSHTLSGSAAIDAPASIFEMQSVLICAPMETVGTMKTSVIGEGGSFVTGPLSEHCRTNMAVIKQLIYVEIKTQQNRGKTEMDD